MSSAGRDEVRFVVPVEIASRSTGEPPHASSRQPGRRGTKREGRCRHPGGDVLLLGWCFCFSLAQESVFFFGFLRGKRPSTGFRPSRPSQNESYRQGQRVFGKIG